MSYESWKALHYPTDASSPEALEKPTTHSLRKWEGLRKAVLDAHGLRMAERPWLSLIDKEADRAVLRIDSDSCALCVEHLNEDARTASDICGTCPLYLTRGQPCDSSIDGQGARVAPWASWTAHRDPEPMIELLKAALMKFPEGAS